MKTDKMNASIARNTNNPGAGELDHAHFVITPGLQWKRGEEIPTTFLNGSQRLQNKVQEHARELERHANIRFKFQPIGHGPASIIISMDPNSGSYSRIGTKSRSAAYENPDAPTMNLSIDDTTPDHEIRRTCMHELLHAIGARHEHQSPAAQIEWDEDAVYDDAARRGWTREKTDHNIVSRHDKHDVQHSRFDPDSIMMYRIRDSWTRDGFTSTGSTVLSETDKSFARQAYPFDDPAPRGYSCASEHSSHRDYVSHPCPQPITSYDCMSPLSERDESMPEAGYSDRYGSTSGSGKDKEPCRSHEQEEDDRATVRQETREHSEDLDELGDDDLERGGDGREETGCDLEDDGNDGYFSEGGYDDYYSDGDGDCYSDGGDYDY